MATTVYFRETVTGSTLTQRASNSATLDTATPLGWNPLGMSTSRGAAAVSDTPGTVAGPTNGIETSPTGSRPGEWISAPFDADVTISGTITFNLRAAENNMNANVAINCIIERLDSTGAIISTVVQTARTTELAVTTEGANNFTATPTSTNMLKGDRLRFRVYGDDSTANMGSGFTFTFWYDGPTAAASGDSYVTFTETFGFLTTAPANTQLFLTDTAGPAVGANIEKEMWTSRGAGAVNIIRNTSAGFVTLQWTDSGGGTAVEWYSKQLNAFTLTGLVRIHLRALESNAAATVALRGEISVCASDGSSPVVWAAGNLMATGWGEIATVETAYDFDISGDDLAVTDGQRLMLRVYAVASASDAMVTGHTATLYYAGAAGATGDSYVQLSQTVTEYVATVVPRNPGINHCDPALV